MENPSWFKEPVKSESESTAEQKDALLESVLVQLHDETEREKAKDLRQKMISWRERMLEENGRNPLPANEHVSLFIQKVKTEYPGVELDNVLLCHMYIASTVSDGRDYVFDLPGGVFENEINSLSV
jgi:hypothetical protein